MFLKSSWNGIAISNLVPDFFFLQTIFSSNHNKNWGKSHLEQIGHNFKEVTLFALPHCTVTVHSTILIEKNYKNLF